jgi:hypothetical protein
MLPGRPFGNEDFVSEMAEGFGRYWTRGRPKKKQALARPAQQQTDQFALFKTCSTKQKPRSSGSPHSPRTAGILVWVYRRRAGVSLMRNM